MFNSIKRTTFMLMITCSLATAPVMARSSQNFNFKSDVSQPNLIQHNVTGEAFQPFACIPEGDASSITLVPNGPARLQVFTKISDSTSLGVALENINVEAITKSTVVSVDYIPNETTTNLEVLHSGSFVSAGGSGNYEIGRELPNHPGVVDPLFSVTAVKNNNKVLRANFNVGAFVGGAPDQFFSGACLFDCVNNLIILENLNPNITSESYFGNFMINGHPILQAVHSTLPCPLR